MAEHLPSSTETLQDAPILRECDMTDPAIREKLFAFDKGIQDLMRTEERPLQYEPMDSDVWKLMIEDCRVVSLESPAGEILGYVGISPTPDFIAERLVDFEGITSSQVLQIVTIAASPGNGYGRPILRHVEEIAINEGYSDIWLYVSPRNERARESYEKQGYIAQDLTSYFEIIFRGPQDHEDKIRIVYCKHIQDLPNDPMARAWHETQSRTASLERAQAGLQDMIYDSTDANKFTTYYLPEEPRDIWQQRVAACIRAYGKDNDLPSDYNPHDYAEELLERFIWHGLHRYGDFSEAIQFFSATLNIPFEEAIKLQRGAQEKLFEAESKFKDARKTPPESLHHWGQDIPKYR